MPKVNQARLKIILKELVAVGRLHKSVGRSGELIAEFDKTYLGIIPQLKHLIVIVNGDPVPYFIQRIDKKEDHWSIFFDEINNPQESRNLVTQTLYLDKGELPISIKLSGPDPKELVGWTIVDATHKPFKGVIKDIQTFPGQTMLILDAQGFETPMIPFVEEWILKVSPKLKQILMDLPEGLVNLLKEKP